jgi:capsular exopolysaccharide synthesis family protein
MESSNLKRFDGKHHRASPSSSPLPHAGPDADGDEGMGLNFSDLFNTVWRGKWIILLTSIVVAGVIGVYTHMQTPIYRASSIVKVDPYGGAAPGASATWWNRRSLSSEVGLLQNSADLGKRIVESLRKREQAVGSEGTFPVLWTESGEKAGVYEVINRLRSRTKFTPWEEQDMIQISVESSVPEEASTIANIYATEYKTYSQEQARASIRAAREFLEEQVNKRQADIRNLEEQWKSFARSNQVVTQGMDGEKIVAEYAALSARRDELGYQLEHDRATLELLRNQLNQFEPELRDKVILESEASGLQSEIEILERRIGELRAEAAQYYVANPNLEGDAQRIQRDFPELAAVLDRIDGFEKRKRELTDRFINEMSSVETPTAGTGATGPTGALGRVAQLKSRIAEQELSISQAEAQIQGLEQSLESYRPRLNRIPEQTIQREQLDRRIAQAEAFYQQISADLQQTIIAEESELGYVETLTQATVPVVPVRPNLNQNVILGILLGLGFGVGLAFLREAMAGELRRPEDLQRKGFNVLGVIPDVTDEVNTAFNKSSTVEVEGHAISSTLLPLLSPWSPVTENYRLIRTNLQFQNRDGRTRAPRTILVTSPEPGDGKTTTAVNLALTFVLSGRRVLLIDADMRRPSAHKLLGMDGRTGLADVLRGDREGQTVRRTFVEGLYFVPAGTTDTPPTEALESAYMRKLIEIGTEKCDVVIIDSPPVLAASDPLILSTLCEATLLVVSSERTEGEALQTAGSMLAGVGSAVTGVIFNRHNEKSARSGYGGYGYYSYNRDPYVSEETKKTYRLFRKTA